MCLHLICEPTDTGADPDMLVAQYLRQLANCRQAELNRAWHGYGEPQGACNGGRQYVANMRSAADYHVRQAVRRRNLAGV